MPKVLHVLEAVEGGTAKHVVDVVRHVTGVDHEVVMPEQRVGGETDRTAEPALVEAGAVVHHLDLRRDPVRLANAAAVPRLVALIRARRPDVVHAHSSIGGLLGRLAATVTRVPRVYTPHGITDVRSGQVVERALGKLTDRFIAVSPSERDLALRLRLVTSDRVVVVPNGVPLAAPATDEPLLDLRAELGLDPSTPLVGTISRLVPQKAPEHLVAAWAAVARAEPDVHFILVGAGTLQDLVDRTIAETGLDGRVHQFRNLANAAGLLDQLDVFTLASRFEGAPYALLEANRAGTPIVATDVVGTRDMVDHGVTGLLAPPEQPDALAALVVELLRDRERSATLAKHAEMRLVREFSVHSMGERLGAIYADLAFGAHRSIS